MFAIYQLAHTTYLHGWSPCVSENCHICCPSSNPPSTIWHRYLQILESFGPFGDECWLTVHASMWWLLDLFFLSPLSISYSTGKFCRKWRLMVNMRRSFNDAIKPYICYTSYSYIPRISPPPIDILSLSENASSLDSAPSICSPPLVLLVFPPPPHYRKSYNREATTHPD
jgi:hypothetical protein